MNYELDDLDRELLQKCRTAVAAGDMSALDEDDFREAVELLVNLAAPGVAPRWPHRCNYLPSLGYVVWRDVFEGQMRCSLEDAVRTRRRCSCVSQKRKTTAATGTSVDSEA
jgi:hypothetical protein